MRGTELESRRDDPPRPQDGADQPRRCWSWRIWPNDRVASSDLEPHRWNEGPGGLWGRCGRRSCPTYDTGSPGSGRLRARKGEPEPTLCRWRRRGSGLWRRGCGAWVQPSTDLEGLGSGRPYSSDDRHVQKPAVIMRQRARVRSGHEAPLASRRSLISGRVVESVLGVRLAARPLRYRGNCNSQARFRGSLNGHSSWAAGGLAAALARTPLGQGGYANPATLPRLLLPRACDPHESVS